MTVSTLSPGSVIAAGAWTGTANIYASDNARATLTTSGTSDLDLGFNINLGTDTVSQVQVLVEHYENQTSQNRLTVSLMNGTTVISSTTLTMRTTEGTQTVTLAATTEQVKNPNFRVRLTGARQGGSGSRTFYVDHVQLIITHEAVVVPSRIDAWNGTTWVNGRLERWNGSAWVTTQLERWDGTSWVKE